MIKNEKARCISASRSFFGKFKIGPIETIRDRETSYEQRKTPEKHLEINE